MIGKKKFSAIQSDIKAEFAEQGIDANQWLAERIEKIKRTTKPNQTELETLKLLRDALASEELGKRAASP